ncbi:MAG TPA: PQQ-binding-like beta-propeller repeat protein [Streptosporangiaceae bacterium]
MRFSRLASAPARRGALALILVGIVVFPGVAARHAAASCLASQCPVRDVVLWSQPLPGSWLAQDGLEGTVSAQGQAYAAVGDGVAVVGAGQEVSAFAASTGAPRWTTTLAGLPPGAAVSSVRAWPGAVTVGVALGNGARREVVLAASSGRQLAAYPAATSGGAVLAGLRRTIVVGPTSVVSYANATGDVAWRIRTGAAQQAWRVAGGMLYMTVSAYGELGTSPVTAIREISMQTGRTRLIRPASGSFAGTLSAVTGGVLVFAGAGGLTMYSIATGRLTGQRAGAVVEGIDPVSSILYADVAGALHGIDPVTGLNAPGMFMPGTAASYDVRAGVALGLDQGGEGSAWGYSLAQRKVIWTTRALPWPHYFVDVSGLGGSTDPVSGIVLIATCAQAGQAVAGAAAAGLKVQVCQRPRLVAIGPRPR